MDFTRHNDRLDAIFLQIVKEFPRDNFTLEMIMYAQDVQSGTDNTPTGTVMFGARDLGGATVHALHNKTLDDHGNHSLMEAGLDNVSLRQWIPALRKNSPKLPSGVFPISDGLLDDLTRRYGIASSVGSVLSVFVGTSTKIS